MTPSGTLVVLRMRQCLFWCHGHLTDNHNCIFLHRIDPFCVIFAVRLSRDCSLIRDTSGKDAAIGLVMNVTF